MAVSKFDSEAFFAALDAVRQSKKHTWKKVAEETGISASTLTRLSQGRRPDVDSMAALCAWSLLNADDYVVRNEKKGQSSEDALAQITTYLRADPNLSRESAVALEALIKTAYERLRQD